MRPGYNHVNRQFHAKTSQHKNSNQYLWNYKSDRVEIWGQAETVADPGFLWAGCGGGLAPNFFGRDDPQFLWQIVRPMMPNGIRFWSAISPQCPKYSRSKIFVRAKGDAAASPSSPGSATGLRPSFALGGWSHNRRPHENIKSLGTGNSVNFPR